MAGIGLKPAPLPAALAPKPLTGAAKSRAVLAPPKAAPAPKSAPKLTGAAKSRAMLAPPKPAPAPKFVPLGASGTTSSLQKAATTVGTSLSAGKPTYGLPKAPKPAKPAAPLSKYAYTRAGRMPRAEEGSMGMPKLLQQLVSFPKTGLEGGLLTGEAIDQTLMHPLQSIEHPLHTPFYKLGKSAVVNDPLVEAATQGSLAPIGNNPLGAAMDVSVVGGLASKAAEAGILGDRAAASFVRPDVTVPGTNTVQYRPNYSLNPIVHGFQRAADHAAGGGLSLSPDQLTNPIISWRHGNEANPQEIKALYRRTDQNWHTDTASRTAADVQDLKTQLKATKALRIGRTKGGRAIEVPGGRDLIGHFQQMLPDNPDVARSMMQKNLDQWRESLAAHKDANGVVANGHLDSIPLGDLRNNIAAMEQGLKLPPDQLQKVINAAKIRQDFETSHVASGRAEMALNNEDQMARRGVVPYATQYMGAVHTDDLAAAGERPLSEAGLAHRDVSRQLGEANGELDSLVASKHDVPMRDIHPDLKPAAKNVKLLEQQLQRARGAGDAARVASLRTARDQARLQFNAVRQELRTNAASRVDALREQEAALANKQHNLDGWVTPVEHGPTSEALQRAIAANEPIHGESPLGQNWKMLDTEEAVAHARANGITPGYLSGSHPDEEAVRRFRGAGSSDARAGRGGVDQKYLGTSFRRGTFDGSLTGSGRSSRAGLNAIARAAAHERLLRTAGIVDENGDYLTYPHSAQGLSEANAYANQFKLDHPGQPLSLVGRYPDKAGNTELIDARQAMHEAAVPHPVTDQVMAAAREGGGTIDPRTGAVISRGIAVGKPGSTLLVPPKLFTNDVVNQWIGKNADKFARDPNLHVGVWHDTKHNEMVLDTSELFPDHQREAAIQAGTDRNEQSVYDITHNDEIPTGGTGNRDTAERITQPPRLALVHTNALTRNDEHVAATHAAPILGTANRLWRGGILPFSANYLQSVPQEGLLRTAMAGINPLRTLPIIGTKLLKPKHFNDLMDGLSEAATNENLDPATRAMARENQTLLHGLSKSGTNIGGQAEELNSAMRDAHRTPTESQALAAKVESAIYRPGRWQLGNMQKLEGIQSRAVLNDWTKDAMKSQGSMEDLVKALSDGKDGSNLAATATQRLDDVLGNYLHKSPIEQKLVRNYTPFLPWLKNATRFVYLTMPRDHPFVTAWLTKVGQANASAWAHDHDNLAPFLMTNFLGTNYGNAGETIGGMDFGRNTPWGIGEATPLQTLSGITLPSIMPILYGLNGDNSFGKAISSGTYGQSIPQGGTGSLLAAGGNALGAIPYETAIKKAVDGLTGHTAKDVTLSHNRALAAFENVIGGSLMPKHYGVYSSGSTRSTGAPPGIGSSSGAPPGIGSSSGAPPGA